MTLQDGTRRRDNPPSFDPAIVHPELIEADLKALAKRWARKPRVKPAKRS